MSLRTDYYETDLCVVGGGLSGVCTAIAAARHGIQVVLIQDRPVFGGNSSSEIRMWVCGARGKDNRETGIIEELLLDNFYSNPSHKFPLWDLTLYSKVMAESNITALLNSSVMDCKCDENKIVNVKAWQSNAETFHIVSAKYFADCSGDSILAPLTGASFRYGREAKSEFGETIPPDTADCKTMGMSCLFQIRQTDHPIKYTPPEWAYTYKTDEDLPYKNHTLNNNFWWIEIGGEWDCVHDTDRCRDECIKICLGVWDHIKNYGDHGAENWDLDWIGFLPGKRESRRYVGEYTVTQNDVESEGRFEDLIAYAGWTMDDHFPEGFNYTAGFPTIFHPAPQPWGLPLRCMISKDISNLTFAGRNISVTHAALSSSRVMATCAVLGQALGTAIAEAVEAQTDIRKIDIERLQNMLMDDDCFLPWHTRKISPLSLKSECNSDIVRNGIDRGETNYWKSEADGYLEYTFTKDTHVNGVRLVFDSNLNRSYHNMPCRELISEKDFILPETLIRSYKLIGIKADGTELSYDVSDSYQRFVRINLDWSVTKLRFVPLSTHGSNEYRVYDFEVF